MKKLLILGGTGFIGRNLVNYYSAKNEFEVYATNFHRDPFEVPNVNFIKADLTNKNDVHNCLKGMDIVIQTAATTSGANDIVNKPYYHVTDNAVMNSLILREVFESHVEKFLFTSCTVMYQSDKNFPLKETEYSESDEIFPTYFGVGWTKVYLEKMCEFFSRISDTKFTVFRHSNIYGPYDKYDLQKSHVFGATVAKVMQAPENSSVTVWGKGTAKRDFLYVDDLIQAVDLAIHKQISNYELVNIGSGEAVSVDELVKKIISISGRNLKIQYDTTKPDIPTSLCLNCDKAEKLYGWRLQTNLDEGIKKTLDWYKKNILA